MSLMFTFVAFIVMIVMVASLTGVGDLTIQIFFGQLAHIAGTSPENINSVITQNIKGTTAHISGQHYGDSFFF